MAYQWDSILETGYERVDNQHRQLVVALNNLSEAKHSGKSDAEVLKTMEFLAACIIKHLKDEEKLQVQYNYPDYLEHKRIHDGFKVVVKGVIERLVKEGPSIILVDQVTEHLGSWFLNHIRGDDFRMAAYVKAVSKEAA